MRDRRVNTAKLRGLIDARRLERGQTMEQFIAAIRPPRSSSLVYAVLSGERQPSLLTANALACALGCTIDDFTTPWGSDSVPADVLHIEDPQ